VCLDMRRYEKMAEASHYAFLYDVETFCPKTRRQVKLTLGSNQQQNGEIVKGEPIFCNREYVCEWLRNFPQGKAEGCFLNSINIETRRRRP
jgi:hypothetical protein